MTDMDLMMRSPEKRFPLLDMMPDIAHPDGFLNIPSLTDHTSNQNKSVHHIASSEQTSLTGSLPET